MNIDRWVLALAGTFILVSLLLAWLQSPEWLWFTAFVGLNLMQAAFTRFCPLAKVLRRFGVRPGLLFS